MTKRIERRNANIVRDRREHKMTYRALSGRYKLSHTQIMNIIHDYENKEKVLVEE